MGEWYSTVRVVRETPLLAWWYEYCTGGSHALRRVQKSEPGMARPGGVSYLRWDFYYGTSTDVLVPYECSYLCDKRTGTYRYEFAFRVVL